MTQDKTNKVSNVPPLRFPEFSGEWEKFALSDFTERVTRRNKRNACRLPLTISAQYGLVDQITFFNKQIASADMSNYYLMKKGEFTYNKSYSGDYPWGAVKRLDRYDEGCLSSLYICFSLKPFVNSDFITHYFETTKWYRGVSEIAGEGARNHGLLNIAIPDYFATKHYLPASSEEQQKIADLFNLLTKRIETQIRVIEDLQTLKKAIIERSYNVGGEAHKIEELIEQVSKRNRSNNFPVLSVNNRLGFIEQADQFEDRTVASDDTSNYKVVSTNDFAYNPARINVGSIARLKDRTNGIVSPMYVCFHTKNTLLPEYMEYFFDTTYFKHEMFKRLEGSVRLCLSYEGLCNISMYIPSIDEQKKLSDRLSAIEQKIQLESTLLEKFKSQKMYLLQQMFI